MHIARASDAIRREQRLRASVGRARTFFHMVILPALHRFATIVAVKSLPLRLSVVGTPLGVVATKPTLHRPPSSSRSMHHTSCVIVWASSPSRIRPHSRSCGYHRVGIAPPHDAHTPITLAISSHHQHPALHDKLPRPPLPILPTTSVISTSAPPRSPSCAPPHLDVS